jgi:ribosomal protein S27E
MFFLFGIEENYVVVECEKCGKVLKYDKRYFTSVSSECCVPNTPLLCKCGTKSMDPVYKKFPDNSRSIKCPKCGSTQLTANKKGFGLGKAAIGTLLAGPIGLAGGFLGSNNVVITCLCCGNKFKPGEGN